MGEDEIQRIERVANCIIKVSEARLEANQKLIDKAVQNLGLGHENILQCIQTMRLLKKNNSLPDGRLQKLKNHYATNLQFRVLISKALGIVDNSDTNRGGYTKKIDLIRSLIQQDPAISTKELSNKLKTGTSSIHLGLQSLEGSGATEDKKIMAKWRAYQNGGSALVEKITKKPGVKYPELKSEMTAKLRLGQKNKDIDELFGLLIAYCKQYDDEKLREILLAHKKAGGYWPKKS